LAMDIAHCRTPHDCNHPPAIGGPSLGSTLANESASGHYDNQSWRRCSAIYACASEPPSLLGPKRESDRLLGECPLPGRARSVGRTDATLSTRHQFRTRCGAPLTLRSISGNGPHRRSNDGRSRGTATIDGGTLDFVCPDGLQKGVRCRMWSDRGGPMMKRRMMPAHRCVQTLHRVDQGIGGERE
jgi:hypothetical protein